jgi:hypothetical protein
MDQFYSVPDASEYSILGAIQQTHHGTENALEQAACERQDSRDRRLASLTRVRVLTI